MGFNLRSHRLVREARQIVATGGIGGVQAVTTTFNDARLEQAGLQPWRTRRSLGGGTLLEKAVHHFDLWRFLLDDEVVDVFARTRSGRSEDEVAAVSAVTERGVLFNALSSDLTSSVHELTVWGDAGSIRVDLYRFDGLERADLEALPGSPRVRLERLGAGMATLLRTAPELRRGGVFDSSYGAEWRRSQPQFEETTSRLRVSSTESRRWRLRSRPNDRPRAVSRSRSTACARPPTRATSSPGRPPGDPSRAESGHSPRHRRAGDRGDRALRLSCPGRERAARGRDRRALRCCHYGRRARAPRLRPCPGGAGRRCREHAGRACTCCPSSHGPTPALCGEPRLPPAGLRSRAARSAP